jgi:DNA-binding XRE family transcriptional regulator
MNQEVEKTIVPNIVHFKQQYKAIVQELVLIRNQANITQQFMAEWLNVDRRKIIAFENLKKIELEILLSYADKLSVDIKFNYIIN